MSKVEFIVETDLPEAELDREAVVDALSKLAHAGLIVRNDQRQEMRRELMKLFLNGVTPAYADIASIELQAKAYRQVTEGADWLTAQQVCEFAGLGTGNPSATVNRWKQERKIFAIQRDNRDLYPRYGLGPDFRPLPQLAKVIALLGHYPGEQLAAWFESTSGFLGGKRPRELLAIDPQRVIDAAKDAVADEQYAG